MNTITVSDMNEDYIKPGYLRVTEILSIFSGLSKIDPEVLANAADRGTLVHKTIEAIRMGIGRGEDPEHIAGYMKSYDIWATGKQFLPLPPRLYCDDHMITGKPDDIYVVEDGLVLVDYKTPAKESKTWRLQAEAYKYLCIKAGYNIVRSEFVRLEKTGKKPKEHIYLDDTGLYFKILEAHRYFFKDKEEESNDLDYL